jgi:hypothetical protein
MNEVGFYLTLALLGAYHGLNPAMGWLFAVALGLQERRLGATLRALPPIAVGHAAAILLTVLIVSALQVVASLSILRYVGAGALLLFGLAKLVRPRHPRWVGMRVGFKDLTAWSFLMASAHGAGLMLVPVLLRTSAENIVGTGHAHSGHMHTVQASVGGLPFAEFATVGVHTLAMFLVMGVVAALVYQKFGLALLRRSWFNLDRLWAVALVATGGLTLVL